MTDIRRLHSGCGTRGAVPGKSNTPERMGARESRRMMRFRLRAAAKGAERVLGESGAEEEKKKAVATENPAGKSRWKKIGLVLAAGMVAGCMDAAPPAEDVDGGDVQEDVEAAEVVDDSGLDGTDAEVEAEVPDSEVRDTDVEADVDADTEVDEVEDGTVEADADCPATRAVTETPAAPDIGPIGQDITENFTATTECDGGETMVLEEHRNVLSAPAARDVMDAAIAQGADTVVFGKPARFTVFRLGIVEFAHYIEGMAGAVGQRGQGGAVDDGLHEAEVVAIADGNVSLAAREIGGSWTDSVSLNGGQYYILPGGRIIMVTSIEYDSAEPSASTCVVAMLEAPVRGRNGGTLSYGGNDYNVIAPVDVISMSGVSLVRIVP